MAQRTREQRTSTSLGRVHRYNGTTVDSHTNWLGSNSCVDNVLAGDGHDLTIRKVTKTGGRLQSTIHIPPISSTARLFDGMDVEATHNPGDILFDPIPITGSPTYGELAAKLLASTNPSRPVVDLPLAAYELREIPDLLRREGNGLIKQFGSMNLKYQFAFRPLMNDILNLLNFGDEVAKREKELLALKSSGLNRKRQLFSGSESGGVYRHLNSQWGFTTGNVWVPKTTTVQVWGHVKWFPDHNGLLTRVDHRNLARRAVLGMTVDFATAWNMFPWTWCVDWFSSIGNHLIGTRNIVGAHHGPIRIMETSTTQGSYGKITSPGTKYSDEMSALKFSTVIKKRRAVTNTLSAHLPYLSARQLSILGAIGVTRRVPRNL
jgi:hypothetical protein